MHIKPKKRLGQNFLVDRNIQEKIIAACGFMPSDIVLEIGSGRGELSGLIAQKVKRIYALEVDTHLTEFLRDKFKTCPDIKIINQDILRFNLQRHFKDTKEKIKVVGNIPYYISSPIIEHLIKFKGKIADIFITVQKEFARRVVACPHTKEYGAFSCFVQYYLEPKIIFNIKKTCFFPSPKVDSSFIRLKVRTYPIVKPKDEHLFFKIIRTAFNYRRKILTNSLTGVVSTDKLERFFTKFKIDPKVRPEALSLQDFTNLTNI